MYLKSIEIIGFKSFAQRTRLVFEPGITAIVGPNGCGKSNISDAIRWVLGEQRPTALRGSGMTDVIFSGTEARKPLGMAEVSIVFADCESALGTEFNEVTVSRRVFRSGEGQYFLNKKPCRLRDIQRLFMDTGVGTSSYSVMAQGQIDAILSSRPEDRRVVFEEASGITRFKADRKEALRKLEQTDANLARVSDVLREIRRNIGSLQRQAARARRYQELQGELRALDLFVTSGRIRELDSTLASLAGLAENLVAETAQADGRVAEAEKSVAAERESIAALDERIAKATEAALQAQGRLAQIRETLRTNEQRIAEYRAWEERDEREIAETRAAHDTQSESLARLRADLAAVEADAAKAETELAAVRDLHDARRAAVETARAQLQAVRAESLDRERAAARAQADLAAAEAAGREAALRLERLAAEKDALESGAADLDTAAADLDRERVDLDAEVARRAAALSDAETARTAAESERNAAATALLDLHRDGAGRQSAIAACKARIQMLEDRREVESGLPGGSRALLDPKNPLGAEDGAVAGPLADHIAAKPKYRRALEAALRPWLDAVVVRDSASAASLLAKLLLRGKGSAARLVAMDGDDAEGRTTKDERRTAKPSGASASAPSSFVLRPSSLRGSGDSPLPRLLDFLKISPDFAGAAERLLGHVFVAPTAADIPLPLPEGTACVTPDGIWMDSSGLAELWMPESALANPLARKAAADDARAQLAELETALAALQENIRAKTEDEAAARRRIDEAAARIAELRRSLDEARAAAARKAGELAAARRDAAARRTRLEEVARDLERSRAKADEGGGRVAALADSHRALLADRDRLSAEAARQAEGIPALESAHAESQSALAEARLRASSLSQQSGHLRSQAEAAEARLAELLRSIESREKSRASYAEGIQRLERESASAADGIPAIEEEIKRQNDSAEVLRNARAERGRRIAEMEGRLHEERAGLESLRARRTDAEVKTAETRLRRQNHLDRLVADYKLPADQPLPAADVPAGPDGAPLSPEAADARIAELRAKIEEMGPVNLVAIEEYRELEDRHAFLSAQEEDLTKGKAEILDLIRRINKESTDLFKDTFEKANANFQVMFSKLFNGGQAQLLLLDGEDVLECGIDIVARPPGKRLQNVSLLSGGERTMTAVALLFAIYMVKPSPFALLDELDAALDDSNIGRFVDSLKGFLSQSQFLIITHNQHTIAGADIVYGVTMPEKGVSKILSLRLKRIGVDEIETADATKTPSIETEPPTLKPRRTRKPKETAVAPAPTAEPAGQEPS